MPLLTYQEVLAQTLEQERTSVLLGNGFSRAWNDGIFNYSNLLQHADFGPGNARLREIFEELNTFDFEAVARALESAHLVTKTYDRASPLLPVFLEDLEQLKNALITAISRTHPARPSDVHADQYTAARRFLFNFSEIFTVNYDLLFYWARNVGGEPAGWVTDDGFRANQRWQESDTDQNIYFLHGGLHIYNTSTETKKLAFAQNQLPIIDQVRDNLDLGQFPLFVSEPSSEKKLSRIERSAYLNSGFRALRQIEGALVIIGHSMDENDRHLFDQIKRSAVTHVFVGIYGDENSDANTRTKANSLAFLNKQNRHINFFDATTAPVWA